MDFRDVRDDSQSDNNLRTIKWPEGKDFLVVRLCVDQSFYVEGKFLQEKAAMNSTREARCRTKLHGLPDLLNVDWQ